MHAHLPEMKASTTCPFSSFTLNVTLGDFHNLALHFDKVFL